MSVFRRDFFQHKSTVTIVKKDKTYGAPIHIGKKVTFFVFPWKDNITILIALFLFFPTIFKVNGIPSFIPRLVNNGK